MKRSYFFIIFSVFVLAACSSGGDAGSDALTPVSVSMKIPAAEKVSAGSRKVSEGVQSVEARVINSAGSPADAPEKKDVQPNDEVVFNFDVLPGQVTTIVEAFSGQESEGTLLFRGEKTENIIAGTNPTIQIDMQVVEVGDVQIFPQNPIVQKGGTEQFSVSGIDPALIDWQLSGTPEDIGPLGIISPDGLYTAPADIPYDMSKTPLGVPISIELKAIHIAHQEPVASITLKLVSGAVLEFTETPKPVSAPGTINTESAGQRSIVFQDGVVYATWAENSDILFAESPDGIDWSDQTKVNTTNFNSQPALALADDGTVYIAFLEDVQSFGRRTVLYRRKPNDLLFESLTQNLNAAINRTQRPSVAVGSDGTVFIAWAENVGGQWDVMFQRLDASGNPLDPDNPAPPMPILNKEGVDEEEPVIGVAKDGKVFLAWIERDFGSSSPAPNALMAMVSLNGGGGFEMPVQVNESGGFGRRPSLVVGMSGEVHIAWEKDTCGDGCYHVAFDKGVLGADGLKFGDDQFVKDFFGFDFYEQSSPSIAWDGANGIYIVLQERSENFVLQERLVNFQEDTGFKYGIFLTKSVDNGETFGPLQSVDNDEAKISFKNDPSVAVDETGRAFAIWTDTRGGISTYVWFAKGE